MSFRLKRWQRLVVGLSCVVLAAAAWIVWNRFISSNRAGGADQIAQLTQRCQTAMIRDVCTVMKGSAPSASVGRLFIAGIGEVDAQAFSSLRAAGDQMCGELATQCTADWMGQACKIGKVLYPDLTKSP